MSKENRLAAKKRVKQAKRSRAIKRCVIALLVIVVIAAAGLITRAAIISHIGKNAAPDSYLNSDGTIKISSAKDYVNLVDYKNLSVNRSELLPTDSELQSSIDSELKAAKETVTEAGTEIKDDSTVVLSYKVLVDGAEVEDLTASSTSYTLGNAKFTDAFDKNIADLTVGDTFNFELTFASDFTNEELAGKTAVFDGSIESVDVIPELTDEWVAENLSEKLGSDYALTADGAKKYFSDTLIHNNLDTWVSKTIVEKTSIKKILFCERYPFFYTWAQYYNLDKNYQNYVDYYNQMLGSNMYSSPKDILGLDSEKEYKKTLKKNAKETVLSNLASQAIYEDAKLTLTQEELDAFCTDDLGTSYEEAVSSYTEAYLKQLALKDKVQHYVVDLVKVNEDTSDLSKADPATDAETNAQ